MTNREWLFEEMKNMSDEELFYMVNFKCSDWEIKSERECPDKTCDDCFSNWLKSEHKEKNNSIRSRTYYIRKYR